MIRRCDAGGLVSAAASVDADAMKCCANCGESLGVPRGRSGGVIAVAWMNTCRPCADLVADQMELVLDQPGRVDIRIWRCRNCGTSRACRSRWRTRCHACLDKRTILEGIDGLADDFAAAEPDTAAIICDELGWERMTDTAAHVWLSARDYDEELDFYARPGPPYWPGT